MKNLTIFLFGLNTGIAVLYITMGDFGGAISFGLLAFVNLCTLLLYVDFNPARDIEWDGGIYEIE